MSQQPEPPASIEAAVSANLPRALSKFDELHYEYAERIAWAVWDALLEEGEILYRSRGGVALFEQPIAVCPERRVLVIPLPVVEPRDTEHA